jgi:phosphoglycolate phosphatase-like HAD superfamily hydrolase
MNDRRKRVLLFDIDGTLLDPMGEGSGLMGKALLEVFGVTGPIESYDMAGKTDWSIITDLMRLAGLAEDQIEAGRERAFAAYARQMEAAVPHLRMQLLPGVPDLLARLAENEHFVLGLVTGNVREAVPHKLRAAGSDPVLFRFGAYGSEHFDRNQLPALALDRLRAFNGYEVSPGDVLVIGDTPHDIACARHAGVKVLCVATGTYDRAALAAFSPDFLQDDLSDIAAVMDILQNY